jgi:hypothetical protein
LSQNDKPPAQATPVRHEGIEGFVTRAPSRRFPAIETAGGTSAPISRIALTLRPNLISAGTACFKAIGFDRPTT